MVGLSRLEPRAQHKCAKCFGPGLHPTLFVSEVRGFGQSREDPLAFLIIQKRHRLVCCLLRLARRDGGGRPVDRAFLGHGKEGTIEQKLVTPAPLLSAASGGVVQEVSNVVGASQYGRAAASAFQVSDERGPHCCIDFDRPVAETASVGAFRARQPFFE